MSFYDAFKDAISLAQKADNIELYRQLLDLSAQALDLQAEVSKLREENMRLQSEINKNVSVVRHQGAYITLADDEKSIPYCAVCYGKTKQLLQLRDFSYDKYFCYNCRVYIDKEN